VLAQSPSLASPVGYLNQKRQNLTLLKNRLISAETRKLEVEKRRFVELTAKLDAMSPLKVLTRGYAMAQDDAGQVIRSVSQVSAGDRITVRLSDGSVDATVTDRKENAQ
jgi:exodeoxyribonuclease VII large subunit